MTNTTINYSDPATIATAIRIYVKTNHPECKFSVTRRNFNVITVALMEAPFEVFTAEAKQQAENDGYYGFELGKGDDYHRTGKFADKFTDEAHAVLNDVQEFMNSLNYDDSDYYTDYFDRGFYDYLKIGKWDKPFKSTAVPAPSKEEKAEEPAPAQEEPTVETIPAALPEMPAAAPADAVYTVHVYMYAGELKKDTFVTEFFNISLADFVKYIEDNADTIENSIGAAPVFDYFVYKNCKSLVNGYARNFKGNMLKKIAAECPDEYASIFAAISDPDKDPDPTKPTRKPNYTAFDTSFKNTKVIAVSFGGATCSGSDENTVPAVSPIDETAAKQGHDSYSTSDYKAGSATAAYNAAVASVKAAADEVRERIPEEYRGELDKLVNRYAAKLADWTNRKNHADASCPSWFITGAANYPHRKHEKQMQRLDSLFKEYDQITALEERIKNFAYECKHRPIKAGDASAPEKLRAKVEELTALQEQMKRENAAARRRGEPAPYGAYSLGNNRQNLKRYADRLAALERAKTAPQTDSPEIKGEGFRVVRNTDIMRLQFMFDSKPDEHTRALLKSNGFKWAPSQKAWQRQLTGNAERAARTVAASL